jgi:hypothetical protein
MIEAGEVTGDTCNRNGCKGVMKELETDRGCSCHICAPCSHCVNAIYECQECGEVTELAEQSRRPAQTFVMPERRTDKERFDSLKDDEFGYVTIAGKYYWMEYWGKYPASMSAQDVVSQFNTCFGYKWLRRPVDGVFHIKVYTD